MKRKLTKCPPACLLPVPIFRVVIPLCVTRGQVRLFCAHGGFKGTLLVNPRLRGVIQLRRTSMKKFPPPLKPPQDKT